MDNEESLAWNPRRKPLERESQGQGSRRTFKLVRGTVLRENGRALDGVVAQLVEHHNGIVGVRGSNPLGSTILCINHLR